MPFAIQEGFPKGLTSDLVVMSWCPTMDLIAICTEEHLAVHRLNWQRLFTISGLDHLVLCLAWSPDGKLLAAGHSDGSVSLYNVEDGELLSVSRAHPSSLSLLGWVPAAAEPGVRESPYVGSVAGRFAPLPQLPKNATPQQLLLEDGPPTPDLALQKLLLFEGDQTAQLDVALSADADARVHLSVHGRFSLGSVQLAQLPALRFDGGSPQLVCAELAPTLHALTAVLRTTTATRVLLPDGTWERHPAGHLLLAFRTGQLGRSRLEIHALALASMQCDALCERVRLAIDSGEAVWRDAVKPLDDKLQALHERVLRESGGETSAATALISLLASGIPTAELHSFFLRELKSSDLIRRLKEVGMAAAALTQLCVSQLHPALEMLVERLGHLEGLAAWPHAFASLGLQATRVVAAISAAISLRASAELLLTRVRKAHAQLGQLLGWLVRVHRQLQDEQTPAADEIAPLDVASLAAFLKAAARRDGIPRDDVSELFTDGAPVEAAAEDPLDEIANLGPPQRLKTARLALEKSLSDCFTPVATHVSAGFQLHSCVLLDAAEGAPPAAADGADAVPRLHLDLRHPPPPPPKPAAAGGLGGAAEAPTAPAQPSLMLAVAPTERGVCAAAGGAEARLVLLRARWALADAEPPAWEVCAVGGAEGGGEAFGSALFYKEAHIALLWRAAAERSTALGLLDHSALTWVPLAAAPAAGGASNGEAAAPSLLMRASAMLRDGRLELNTLEPERARTFSKTEGARLALSQQRGMACLVTRTRRVLLLDLEDDDDDDDEDDDDDDADADTAAQDSGGDGADVAMDEDD